eukprot:jgi/Psemu1/26368/gm1.26368_g
MAVFQSSSVLRQWRGMSLIWNALVASLLISISTLRITHAEEFGTLSPTPGHTSSSSWGGDDDFFDYNGDGMKFFSLPSMAITLDVDEKSDDQKLFQDQLTEHFASHLEKFYNKKLLTSEIGNPTFLDVDLDSRLLWTERANSPKTHEEHDAVKQYEVRVIFDCKVKLLVEPIVTEDGGKKDKLSLLNHVLMDLFFLEAFEDDYQWELLHGFLSVPLLQSIINVDIVVMDSGFVHPRDQEGNLIFQATDDDFYSNSMFDFAAAAIAYSTSRWTTIGIIVGATFVAAIAAIWLFLCVCLNGTRRFRFARWLHSCFHGGYEDEDDYESFKGTSVTGSTSSDEDDDSTTSVGRHSQASYNLDAWANAITSIPLRNPLSRNARRKRGQKVVKRPYFRPSHEHSSDLSCITEADNESACSTIKSGRSGRSNKRRGKRPTRPLSSSSSSLTPLPSESSVSSALRSIIYEEYPDNEIDTNDNDNDNDNKIEHENDNNDDNDRTMQSAAFLITDRGLIQLVPSEDEDEDEYLVFEV